MNSNKKESYLPLHIHEPFYTNSLKKNMQNTDPYVYGNTFLYSCCQQNINRKSEKFKEKGIIATNLQDLDTGSLILFGSRVGGDQVNYQFVLDTVFVVSSYIEYSLNNILKLENHVSCAFYKCVLSKIGTPNDSSVKCTLYFGETYINKTDGPFCFVICKPFLNNLESFFPRLILDIDKYALSQRGRNTGFKDTILEEIWDKDDFKDCSNESQVIKNIGP